MKKNMGSVLYEVKESIATVTLNRPERRNSLGGTLREDIADAMNAADADADVRVVILTGAGSAFCAGGDLKEMVERFGGAEGRSLQEKITPPRDKTLLSIYEANKPVIAAINGPALGAGMNLALAADIRIASTDAVFSQSFVKRGLLPDYGGTFLLPRAVGFSKAFELVFTGDTIDAQEALRLQMVSKVVEPRELMAAAWKMATSIASSAPLPIRLAKRAMNKSTEGDLRDALDREAAAQNVCFDTEDGQEGLRAFIEKRPPVFRGK
ncbi:MAG: enoyl-CoA hydratase-related protein [Sulfuricaulis sp.]|nr:enoyl-CoA hydratase-related protein [Sulfuricaulis sp.]